MSKGWYVTVETNVIFRVDTKIGVVASTERQAKEVASEIITSNIIASGLDHFDLPWEFTIGGMEWHRSGDAYADDNYIEPIHAEPDSDFDPDEPDSGDLMEASMCLLESFWNLPDDDRRRSDYLPNYGIAMVRDQIMTSARLCHQTWLMAIGDGFDQCFDWDFCPRFLDQCMDDQLVVKSDNVSELFRMWKGD